MPVLNLGIVAHVDAGKTSLTERLLYAGGVIDRIGSVDGGDTQTDSLALERRRGITIKTAVASFPIGGVTVNLIDTPGHPDFIAEVERALRVLDGAVLVVSAVEGVQAQPRVLMRTLRRLRVPTLIFVNKIDRQGARGGELLREIAARLTPDIIAVSEVSGLGTGDASARSLGFADLASRLVDLSGDDRLLADYVRDERSVPSERLRSVLLSSVRKGGVFPVFFGSAVTGAGVDALMTGLVELLPAAGGDPEAPVSATVFKVERDRSGARVAYARLFAGTLHTRDRVLVASSASRQSPGAADVTAISGSPGAAGAEIAGSPGVAGAEIAGSPGATVVTGIEVIDGGAGVRRTAVSAGEIARLHGLRGVRIGDAIGRPRDTGALFAPPTLETVVEPRDPGERRALHAALTELADQDPLINLRVLAGTPPEIAVSLYGEVQKEVIETTLAEEYGIAVTFRATSTILIERPAGTGTAGRTLGQDGNPYLATLDLTVEPAPIGAGVVVELDVPIEQVPIHVFKTTEFFRAALAGTARQALDQGPHGRRVTDIRLLVSRTGYVSPGTTAADFRKLLPVVLETALARAGTVVCEPIHAFTLDGPADTLGVTLGALARAAAIPLTQQVTGTSFEVTGHLPAARLREVEQMLPGLTHGEGLLESVFHSYRPIRNGRPPY